MWIHVTISAYRTPRWMITADQAMSWPFIPFEGLAMCAEDVWLFQATLNTGYTVVTTPPFRRRPTCSRLVHTLRPSHNYYHWYLSTTVEHAMAMMSARKGQIGKHQFKISSQANYKCNRCTRLYRKITNPRTHQQARTHLIGAVESVSSRRQRFHFFSK